MPSEAATAALRDIKHHIDLAIQFCAALKYDGFRDDTRTVYAVIRCLEIISEASRRLPEEMKELSGDCLERDGGCGQCISARL